MQPIIFDQANHTLKAPPGADEVTKMDILDLPVFRGKDANDMPVVRSCWQCSPEEIMEIRKTGKIYLSVMGFTHPPLCVTGFNPVAEHWEHLKEATLAELLDRITLQAIEHVKYIREKYQDPGFGAGLLHQLEEMVIGDQSKEAQS
jgi:hypothetical protein